MHQASFGTYGSRRVHAELRLGLGIAVGHGAVELLMRRAGLVGLPGRKRRRLVHDTAFAADLVDRNFARQRPDELWVTDIERHEALWIRVEVRDLRRRAVAAGRLKLGAA